MRVVANLYHHIVHKMLLCLFLSAMSMSAADRITDAYQHEVDLVEHDVLSLAEAMPADKYDFTPAAFAPGKGAFTGVRTFGEQVRHLATMIYMTSAIVMQERSPYGPGANDNGPNDIRTKAQTVEYLKGSFAYARKAIATLNEKNHLDSVGTYFGAMTKAAVASGIAYHSYNHYGQMVVYARMNGVTPPPPKP
jgi:hypothetical protein